MKQRLVPREGRVRRPDRKVPAVPPARVKAIALVVVCIGCGEEFSPSHDSYVRGDWRRCSDCRSPQPASALADGQHSRDGPLGYPES